MNKDYAILTYNGVIVDVVTYLACAIGMLRRWSEANPNVDFNYREATPLESNQAHLIQTQSMRNYNFPD